MANSTTFLDQAIQEKNVRKIRSAIVSYIMADPLDRNNETLKVIDKVKSAGIHIWEEHDGRDFEHDRTKWDKKYFSQLQAQLMTNFSKERFHHTMEVGKEVYKGELTAKSSDSSNHFSKVNISRNVGSKKNNTSLGKNIVAGMVVIATAAVLYYLIKYLIKK
ncbi:hypothetical protein [Parageobacillus thermoglucosidasius]|uniref:Uncharacterized protein n=1 Tax=Parageobacillus thermoglucosidasius TaxID=1426 RepID=A0AAN0YPI2_PARTM|nr:hypothetical protein [Parageobacillus thermoglucosidasius]AEH48651.1 hypothetical protein Geoth_2763 [Parageobacillus thermoglucosidasius C56-YS93]ALF10092.1 hypothetical protein AOT13_08775 [Parageobacillus thermoglucosidasius]ANZ30174.1 hypothetical protein BCV53_08785 [Parageobacillus thermoglucosidasius]APM80911.1 hypothetical protein BCV54_08790 [Parageobacillus thermoglucosidasius]KJX70627.1 hypothetical protein WH82_00475 [Parageobacillus thermoglucosidasius]